MRTLRLLGFPVFATTTILVACSGGSPSTFAEGASSGGNGDGGGGAQEDGGLDFGNDAAQDGGGVQGRACDKDAQCGTGGLCDLATHTCGCGGTAIGAQPVAPNLLVVQDRSCSMTEKVGAMSKWQIAVTALEKMTTDLTGKARFGLELFPDKTGDACTQDAIAIPVSDTAGAALRTLLDASLKTTDPLYPAGPCVTNIDTAVIAAAADPGLADPAHAGSVVLITDGAQAGCSAGGGNAGTVKALTDLAKRGVGTYVIGFGNGVNVAALDSFAVAGGRVNAAGPHKFYDAQDTASLDATLAAIGKAASLTCDLALAAPPPGGDPSLIYVYLDHVAPAIPRDPGHMDGWDYDATTKTVHFYGGTCDRIKHGAVASESVVFGCPGGAPPPPK
jgi:hypothetical protein